MSFYKNVKNASIFIKDHIRKTDLDYSKYFSALSSNEVYFKLENTQITGSFKIRGAFNKLLSLSQMGKKKGIVTASTGNHGLAVAYASNKLNIPCKIYVPNIASDIKVNKIKKLGSKVIYFGEDCLDAEKKARKDSMKEKLAFISPYNDEHVMSGQGTLAVELIEQIKKLDVVIVSVGGGGLISGISKYLKSTWPEILVVGCSPENSPAMINSMYAGKILDIESKPTLSDGTAGGLEPGSITFPICCEFIDQTILVTEDEIKKAMELYYNNENQIIEGAAGVAIATFLKIKNYFSEKKVGVIICGGNIDKKSFLSLINTN
ncbi:MAG: threonine/serine dehydratase [Candidatus Neomarinimicrobiota bacterium]